MKERIYYLDIAKALVIVGTILLHIGSFHAGFGSEGDCWVFGKLVILVGLLHCPYSMPAFFMMRGYYNKERSLVDEIKSGCKRLIVPMFLLYYLPGGDQWFCYAMFFALIMYNLIHRIPNKWAQFVIMLGIGILGAWMNEQDITWRYIHLGCALLPFFWFGERCRWIIDNNKVGIFGLIGYIAMTLGICAANGFSGSQLQELAYHIFINGASHLTIEGLLLCYPWALFGTSAIFWIARLIKRNRILEFIGRNSMVFYLFHFNVLYGLLMLFNPYIASIRGPHSGIFGLIVYAAMFVVITGVCALASKFVNKYCPWAEGRGL